MATSGRPTGHDTSDEVRKAVELSQWEEAIRTITLSDERHCWAITQIVERAPVWLVDGNIDVILDSCADDLIYEVVSRMLRKHLSRCADRKCQRVIKCTKYGKTVVDESVCHPQHQGEERTHVLAQLMSRGMWRSVGRVLERVFSTAPHSWSVTYAGVRDERDDEDSLVHSVLSRYQGQELEQMLEQAGRSLEHWWAVGQASRCAGGWSFSHYILPQCHDEELELLLSRLVSRGLWKLVGKVLERGVSSTLHSWAVKEALKNVDDHDFVHYILAQYPDEELEHIIPDLVSWGMWGSVGKVLERGVSSSQHTWAVEEAHRHADDHRFDLYILPQCHHEELGRLLSRLVSRDRWKSVGKVLERGVSSTLHTWAVKEALKYAGDEDFVHCILAQYPDEKLENIITDLVSRGLWKSVGKVLERGVSSSPRTWAVEQAHRRADDHRFALYILPQCHDEELKRWFRRLVSRGMWMSVGKELERGVSSRLHTWAVEQAHRRADDHRFALYILPQCHDEELERLFRRLVSRGMWKSVGKVLERGVSSTLHTWAVEQARRRADDHRFALYILSQCHRELLEPIITDLVSWDRWKSVGKVLEQGVSSTKHTWAVKKALKNAGDKDFVLYILPQCHDEELAYDVFPQCHDKNLEPLLAHLVSRGLWKSVEKVLERGVSSTLHTWAVKEALKNADDEDLALCILPRCHDEELEHLITHLVSRGLWRSVSEVLQRGISPSPHTWAVVEAANRVDDTSFDHFFLNHCSKDDLVTVFPLLVASKKWKCTQRILYDVVRDTLYTWMTSGQNSEVHDMLFWKFIHRCHVEVSLALDLTKAVTQTRTRIGHDSNDMYEDCFNTSCVLAENVSWQGALCESLMISLLHTLCYVMCSDGREYTDNTEHTKQYVSEIYSHLTACIKDNTNSAQDSTLKTIKNKMKWTSVFTKIADSHKTDPLFLLHFLQGLNLYHFSRRGLNDDAILLEMFAVFPLFPQLQSVALKTMLRKKKWDIISQACLSHVWEHDQRQLFKIAVEQRQWDVVWQWSDHIVHDDQREWAMEEAFKEEEWEVYLLLADHGLTMPEHMHAYYMVAKYGNWDTVLQMVERGGDITEVSNLLENWVTGNLRKKPQGDVTVFMKRCEKLIRMKLRFAKESVRSPMKALRRGKWGSVLYNILHNPVDDYFSLVLNNVIEQKEWHILMHLVRLGMNAAERNWLFPEMVRQQCWGVCRKLLEIGVDDQLCVEALPELMERNQWTLVARVMECDVDDAVRRQVIQWAFQRRAGALFLHCLTCMKYKQHLSVETQKKLFHQAISRNIWQAVKPLMLEKDGPRIQHRDMAFLEAIEQHLWDVVDHCQLHHADINMKDENGETPLHREARKREWKAVEEIVLRDGKPNLLDKDGVSVLNRLIHHKQWNSVKIVIMYGGDIHVHAKYSDHGVRTHTPLQALIDARQADVIQFSIMWCGDQKKGVNDRGETALHAACDSDRSWNVMEDFIVRKVDPLTVTKTGQSPLVYAVLNTKCPGRMVAECSKLGFSSHQPSVTGSQESVLHDIGDTVIEMWHYHGYMDCDYLQHSAITSPLVCAVLRDLPVVALMLHESGSCSPAEFVTLCKQLHKLTDLSTQEGRTLHGRVQNLMKEVGSDWGLMYADNYQEYYTRLIHSIGKNAAFLRELAATPRSLRSSCRLRISHHYHYSDTKRHERLDWLPLPEPLKNYLEFSDLCDPDYGKDMGLQSADWQDDEPGQVASDETPAGDLSSEHTASDYAEDDDL